MTVWKEADVFTEIFEAKW